jgi:hypothetical protein
MMVYKIILIGKIMALVIWHSLKKLTINESVFKQSFNCSQKDGVNTCVFNNDGLI